MEYKINQYPGFLKQEIEKLSTISEEKYQSVLNAGKYTVESARIQKQERMRLYYLNPKKCSCEGCEKSNPI